MKYLKIIYATLIIGIIAAWIVFFSKRANKNSANISKTEIVISNKIINVGNTKHNVPVEANFEIINKGTNPLIITDITTDCNCTVPNWDHDPIMPNNITLIRLVYNGYTPGYFQKKAYVTCNTQNSPVVLVLRGNVIMD